MLITQNISAFGVAMPNVCLEISASSDFVDLGKGMADIAIRNRLPRSETLIQRNLGGLRYSVYGRKDYVESLEMTEHKFPRSAKWVTFNEANKHHASYGWLLKNIPEFLPYIRCSNSRAIFDVVMNGGGLGLLPDFAAVKQPALQRVSMSDLSIDIYLVSRLGSRRVVRIEQTKKLLYTLFRDALR